MKKEVQLEIQVENRRGVAHRCAQFGEERPISARRPRS